MLEILDYNATIDGLVSLQFYREINGFLRDEIMEFQQNLLLRMFATFGLAAIAVLTTWILLQGYRIVIGQSRQSMMQLVVDSSRATLIVMLATGFALGNGTIYEMVTEGLGNVIISSVTASSAGPNGVGDLYDDIDRSLAVMNLALGSVEAIQVAEVSGEPNTAESNRTRNLYFAGFGTGGPAIVAGAMLTLNKVAIALFIGLGPLFIMCLLFDQTKSLFQRWLLYGIGTWFSLGVLYVMSIIAMDLTLAVAGAFWGGKMLEVAGQQGINSMAVQQAGLGVILTMLLITVPGMAAAFFQGTLGQFMHYSAFDKEARGVPSAHGPAGAPAYSPASNRSAQPAREIEMSSPLPALGPSSIQRHDDIKLRGGVGHA